MEGKNPQHGIKNFTRKKKLDLSNQLDYVVLKNHFKKKNHFEKIKITSSKTNHLS